MRGIGPLVRRYGVELFTTEGTLKKSGPGLGRIPKWKPIRAGEPVMFGDLSVEPFSTSHDAEEPVAFVIQCGNLKLGHVTDLGKVTREVKEKLQGADALLVESNHDVEMLHSGPYPWPVKQRIKSDVGHLSNEACADLLASVCHSRLKVVVLMHMSETNNRTEIAGALSRQALGGVPAEIVFARQESPSRLISV